MRIADNALVSIRYDLHDEAGTRLDQSGDEPFQYIHGLGRIIDGLEKALAGHQAGDRFDAVIAAKDAYGEHDPALDIELDASVFPENARERLEPGLRFRARHPHDDERMAVFTITAVADGRIHASANHELAGKALTFAVEVVEVRPATEEEIEAARNPKCGGCASHGSCSDGSCSDGSCSG